MKKFLTIIFLSVFMCNQVFAASWQIQEARNYMQQGKYQQALQSVNSAIDSDSNNNFEKYMLRAKINKKLGNSQQSIEDLSKSMNELNTSNISPQDKKNTFITIFNEIIKYAQDTKMPVNIRLGALSAISEIYTKFGNIKDANAAFFKSIQLMSLFITKDEHFKEKIETLSNGFSNTKSYEDEVLLGLFEYSIGNKEKGIKIANGAINEISSKNSTKANELREYFNYIKNVLDNGLPNNQIEFLY